MAANDRALTVDLTTKLPPSLVLSAWDARYSRGLSVKSFGALGDGATDDTAAIQLALDAAVAANVPAYFPSGTYIVSKRAGSDYMLQVAKGSVLTGDGGTKSVVKVAPNAGDYRSVVAGSANGSDLTGLVVRDLGFDQNTTNNPVTANSSLFSGFPRYAIYAAVGSGIMIRDCMFSDIDSVNTISCNGTAVSEVSILRNRFVNVGTSGTVHDHSTIYFSGVGCLIADNRIEGVAGGKGATTAIETHGSAQVVRNNHVSDFYVGANITGVAAVGSSNILVHDNIFRGVNIGVSLWSMSPGSGLKNVDVHDNLIDVAHDAWLRTSTDYCRGIMLDPGMNVDITNLSIHHNAINFADSTAAAQAGELQSAGIALWAASATPTIRRLRVESNTIVNAPSVGIRLAVTVIAGRVADNEIIDPGSSSDSGMANFYRAGLALVGTFSDLLVERNRTIDTRATGRIIAGVSTSITAATRCSARENRTVRQDGTLVPPFSATAGDGKYFLFHESMQTYQTPGSAQVGSSVTVLSTGDRYVQTTVPFGTAWTVRSL